MRLGRNLVAGVGGSLWAAAIGLAMIPFYLDYLGIEAYGLIGFLVTMQSLMQVLDAGLSAAMSREIARSTVDGEGKRARDILRTFAAVYWATALAIALGVFAAASSIAGYWLEARTISSESVVRAVMLMGFVVACRWPASIYLGALTGTERLVAANIVTVVTTTVGSVGAVFVLAFVSPTIEAFFLWQAAIGILNVMLMRAAAWQVLGGTGGRFDPLILRQVWRFSAAMSGVTLSAILFSQLDKVVLSKILPLADFGVYMLATTVVSILYRLITPMFSAIYPRFSALVAANDTDGLRDLYRTGTNLFAILLFPIAMAMVLGGEAAVAIWTGDPVLAARTGPLIGVLAIGSAIHGMMYFPYALQLAFGAADLPLRINILLSVVLLPTIPALAIAYGAMGGALSWLLLHVLYLLLGTWLTHRRFLIGVGGVWLVRDVGVPLATSMAVGGLAWAVIAELAEGPLAALALGSLAFAAAVVLSHWFSQRRAGDIRRVLSDTPPLAMAAA